MIKPVPFISVVVLLFSAVISMAQESVSIYESTLEKENLRGPVKRMKQTCHSANTKDGIVSAGEQQGHELDNFEMTFDVNGKMITRTGWMPSGTQMFKILLDYDSLQQLVRETYISEGYEEVTTWKYDNGLLIEENNLAEDKIFFYKYEQNKLQLRIIFYRQTGEGIKDSITCDSIGRKIESRIYLHNSSFFSSTRYTYDQYGNQNSIICYDKNNQISERQVMEYDASGKLLETSRYGSGGTLLLDKITIRYDENENMISWISTNGSGAETIAFYHTYDDYGNRTSNKTVTGGNYTDREETITYEYDSYNNWTKQIVYENGTAEEVNLREIVYY